MKRMLKYHFMMVLITAICMALIASISWAGSRVTFQNNTSYDTESRHSGVALKVNSGYSGYHHLRRYGNHGHNKHGYRHNRHRNSYSNHPYYRQRNSRKHNNIRPRHGRRNPYNYKQGYSGRNQATKYGYLNRHYVYMDDDKYNPKGYKRNFGKGDDNYLKHASEPMTTRITRINKRKGHVYIDKGKSAGFKMGSKACIYLFSGETIACGRVRKISPSHAMIEINNRKAKQFNNGMEAMLVVEEKDPSSAGNKKGSY